MTPSSKTIFVFSVYLVGMGVGLVLMPDLVLGTLGFPPTDEIWPRVVGVLALALAYYYVMAARSGVRLFVQWTVSVRIGVFVAFTTFALMGLAGPVMILLGAVDLVAALWTAWALRKEDQSGSFTQRAAAHH